MKAIRDSPSNLACCDHVDDVEDKDDDDDDPELCKLSDDDERSWVMGRISKTVQHQIEGFWQKQMNIDQLA